MQSRRKFLVIFLIVFSGTRDSVKHGLLDKNYLLSRPLLLI